MQLFCRLVPLLHSLPTIQQPLSHNIVHADDTAFVSGYSADEVFLSLDTMFKEIVGAMKISS